MLLRRKNSPLAGGYRQPYGSDYITFYGSSDPSNLRPMLQVCALSCDSLSLSASRVVRKRSSDPFICVPYGAQVTVQQGAGSRPTATPQPTPPVSPLATRLPSKGSTVTFTCDGGACGQHGASTVPTRMIDNHAPRTCLHPHHRPRGSVPRYHQGVSTVPWWHGGHQRPAHLHGLRPPGSAHWGRVPRLHPGLHRVLCVHQPEGVAPRLPVA